MVLSHKQVNPEIEQPLSVQQVRERVADGPTAVCRFLLQFRFSESFDQLPNLLRRLLEPCQCVKRL